MIMINIGILENHFSKNINYYLIMIVEILEYIMELKKNHLKE